MHFIVKLLQIHFYSQIIKNEFLYLKKKISSTFYRIISNTFYKYYFL